MAIKRSSGRAISYFLAGLIICLGVLGVAHSQPAKKDAQEPSPGPEGPKPGGPRLIGTWKLDEAKSKISAGAPKNTTVVYEAAGDSVKVTVEGLGADGKPSHIEWTGKFDGKDYPVTGDPTADTRSYRQIDARTLELTNKKDGKVIVSGKITVAANGKTRTVVIIGTDASGKKVSSTAVYDKQ